MNPIIQSCRLVTTALHLKSHWEDGWDIPIRNMSRCAEVAQAITNTLVCAIRWDYMCQTPSEPFSNALNFIGTSMCQLLDYVIETLDNDCNTPSHNIINRQTLFSNNHNKSNIILWTLRTNKKNYNKIYYK